MAASTSTSTRTRRKPAGKVPDVPDVPDVPAPEPTPEPATAATEPAEGTSAEPAESTSAGTAARARRKPATAARKPRKPPARTEPAEAASVALTAAEGTEPAEPAEVTSGTVTDPATAAGTPDASGTKIEMSAAEREAAEHVANLIKGIPETAEFGDALFDEIERFLRRFVIAPDHYLWVMVLWAAHTWALRAMHTTPRLAVNSKTPGSGKSRVLGMLELLCSNAYIELDPTGPALAATIELELPTLLIDESDIIFGETGSSGAKRQLRGILNAGYKRSGTLRRKSGKTTHVYHVFCPVAFGGLGRLPETLRDRSIQFMMEKPPKGSRKAERFDPRVHAPLGRRYGEVLGDWARTKLLEIIGTWVELPEGIDDRPAEVWEPILAMGIAAGPKWKERAYEACGIFALDAATEPAMSPAERLVRDLRGLWPTGEDEEPVRNWTSAEMILALFRMDGSSYAKMWDAVNAPRELAALLATYNIAVRKVKVAGKPLQGYRLIEFRAVWESLDEIEALQIAARAEAEEEEAATAAGTEPAVR